LVGTVVLALAPDVLGLPEVGPVTADFDEGACVDGVLGWVDGLGEPVGDGDALGPVGPDCAGGVVPVESVADPDGGCWLVAACEQPATSAAAATTAASP
jgi:hypothetical protein